ncbi:MAG: HPP family protein [Byssovorax sp.]
MQREIDLARPLSGTPVPAIALHGRWKLAGEGAALLYLGSIAALGFLTPAHYVFFPELAALAYDVFTRPGGKWAKAPWFLALTPALAGAAGVVVTRYLPYGAGSMLLIVGITVAMVKLLRSPLAPAISAGVLPLVMGIESGWYPPSILLGTCVLALLSQGWSRVTAPHLPGAPASPRERVDDLMEAAPRRWGWAPPLLVFVTLDALLAERTGLRMLLFPPLVVIAFEMFSHPTICPWARRPLRLPIACGLTAVIGWLSVRYLGAGVAPTVVSLALAIGVLRVLDLHVPPALAVALIPQVMHAPDWRYPVSVTGGTTLLLVVFFLARPYLSRQPA